jgi:hypothetical protein
VGALAHPRTLAAVIMCNMPCAGAMHAQILASSPVPAPWSTLACVSQAAALPAAYRQTGRDVEDSAVLALARMQDVSGC